MTLRHVKCSYVKSTCRTQYLKGKQCKPECKTFPSMYARMVIIKCYFKFQSSFYESIQNEFATRPTKVVSCFLQLLETLFRFVVCISTPTPLPKTRRVYYSDVPNHRGKLGNLFLGRKFVMVSKIFHRNSEKHYVPYRF